MEEAIQCFSIAEIINHLQQEEEVVHSRKFPETVFSRMEFGVLNGFYKTILLRYSREKLVALQKKIYIYGSCNHQIKMITKLFPNTHCTVAISG